MKRILAPLFLLALLGLVGCGSGGDAAGNAKNEESQPAEQIDVALEGTWQGQMIVNEAEAAKKLQPEQLEALKALQMQMTFRDDGTLTLAGETDGTPYESHNRWDLVGVENNKITITSVDPEGNAKNIDLFFNDSHTFDMPLSTEVADLGAMRFTRVR